MNIAVTLCRLSTHQSKTSFGLQQPVTLKYILKLGFDFGYFSLLVLKE
jgi:hypothetical protein